MKRFKKLIALIFAFIMTMSCMMGVKIQSVYAANAATGYLSASSTIGSRDPVIITGTIGTTINENVYIQFEGASNKNPLSDQQDLSSWCTNLPDGVKLIKAGDAASGLGSTIYLVLKGTPTSTYDGMLSIKVPNSELIAFGSGGEEIPADGIYINMTTSHITISKIDQNAPTGLTEKDGVISGVNSTMQYSTDGGNTWLDVTNSTITGFDAGITVKVRYKETTDHKASDAVDIVTTQKFTLTGTITGDDLPEKITFTRDGKIYEATVTETGNKIGTYSIDLFAGQAYTVSATGKTNAQECTGTVTITNADKVVDFDMVRKTGTTMPPNITGVLATDIAARAEYTISLTEVKKLPDLLQSNGIPHVGSCVIPTNVMKSGESISLNSLNITAQKIGISTITFNVSTKGCAFYGTQAANNLTITVKVVLPQNSSDFLTGILHGTKNSNTGDVTGFYTAVTKNNMADILAGENLYNGYTDLEKDAINAKLAPTTYEDMLAAAKFLSQHTETENHDYLNNVDSKSVDQILDEESEYNNLSDAQKTLVNDALTNAGVKKYPDILAEAKKFVDDNAKQFKEQYLNDLDNYDNIVASEDDYDKMSNAEKAAIDALVTPSSYKEILDNAKAKKFIVNHMTRDDNTIVTKSEKNTLDNIIYGEDDFNTLTADQQFIVNKQLADAGATKTYQELLNEAKTSVEENSLDFIEKYVSDENDILYKDINSTNYEQILSGSDIWNELSKAEKESINKKLTSNGGKTYEELIVSAELLRQKSNHFITKYLTDNQGNVYKTANIHNYAQILSGQSDWNKLTQDEKDAINAQLVASGGRTYEELLKLAEEMKYSVTTEDDSSYVTYGMMTMIALAGILILKKRKEQMN